MNKNIIIGCLIALAIIIISTIVAIKAKNENFSNYEAVAESSSFILNPVKFIQDDFETLVVEPTNSSGYPERNNWKENAKNKCKTYNNGLIPKNLQSCPDSSFDFVTDLTRYIKGANYGGCIQLKDNNYPNCWSDDKGNYSPWFQKLELNL